MKLLPWKSEHSTCSKTLTQLDSDSVFFFFDYILESCRLCDKVYTGKNARRSLGKHVRRVHKMKLVELRHMTQNERLSQPVVQEESIVRPDFFDDDFGGFDDNVAAFGIFFKFF